MREFRFDTATRRAMLNGKPCFLRGASFELQRFFGDPKCGDLPWDEAWVRKVLADIPRDMHWNCFRATLGQTLIPAVRRLDLSDRPWENSYNLAQGPQGVGHRRNG